MFTIKHIGVSVHFHSGSSSIPNLWNWFNSYSIMISIDSNKQSFLIIHWNCLLFMSCNFTEVRISKCNTIDPSVSQIPIVYIRFAIPNSWCQNFEYSWKLLPHLVEDQIDRTHKSMKCLFYHISFRIFLIPLVLCLLRNRSQFLIRKYINISGHTYHWGWKSKTFKS